MWNEPYLETCCRSALHRLTLVQGHGRPGGLKDGPCLNRLGGMGLAAMREDGRWEVTPTGRIAHGRFIRAPGHAPRHARKASEAVAAAEAAAPVR